MVLSFTYRLIPGGTLLLSRNSLLGPQSRVGRLQKPSTLSHHTAFLQRPRILCQGRSFLLQNRSLLVEEPVIKHSLGSSRRIHILPRLRGQQASKRLVKAAEAMATAADPPPEGYRANVGVCLVNGDNKVFVAARLDKPGAWQMPQGGIDAGETVKEAAVRELREETGVTSATLLGEVSQWLCYDFPPDVREKITALWGTPWKGQAQKWVLFRFDGQESEINLEGDGTEPPEFSEWKWMRMAEVVDEAVEFKKPVYIAAFKEFAPILGINEPIQG